MRKLKENYEHLVKLQQEGKLTEERKKELKEIYENYDTITGYEFISGELNN